MSESDDVYSRYAVVINEEEQYSIWPTDRELPLGWRLIGMPYNDICEFESSQPSQAVVSSHSLG